MAKDNYNWWTDPKNKKEVDRISWWNHPENQTTIELPVAIVSESEGFTITTKDEYLGKNLHYCCSGKTKEEAIKHLFEGLRFISDFDRERVLNYQRWVPFRKGPWGQIGGKWFAIFGIHVYFRYEKRVKMKGGWYIPFTKLNISVSSDWAAYKRYKSKNNEDI